VFNQNLVASRLLHQSMGGRRAYLLSRTHGTVSCGRLPGWHRTQGAFIRGGGDQT
jgi:hypothetical protein